MGLDDILSAIHADTDAEITDVLVRARNEVSSIEARARIDGEAAAAAILEAAEVSAQHEAEQIVILARSSVDRRLVAAIEEEYQQILDHLREALAQIRGSPRYAPVLHVLLEEALARLPEATVVSVDPADAALVRELLERRDGPTPSVDPSLTSIGGITVSTGDGRVVHNTFEVRIRRADGLLRAIAGCYLTAVGSPQ